MSSLINISSLVLVNEFSIKRRIPIAFSNCRSVYFKLRRFDTYVVHLGDVFVSHELYDYNYVM